jgi:hypothetical protein
VIGDNAQEPRVKNWQLGKAQWMRIAIVMLNTLDHDNQ